MNETTMQDTVRAEKDIIVKGDVTVKGKLKIKNKAVFNDDVLAKQGVLFDNANDLKYTPATATFGAIYEIGNITPHANKSVPYVSCPIPGTPGSIMALNNFNGVYRAYSINGLINATTEMYNTPWNGYGHIEVQGTDQNGLGTNELLINFWCGRNTGINTGPNGGKTYFGNLVEIGFPVLKNVALNIKGKKSQDVIFNIDDEFDGSVFKVKRNGATQIGAKTVISGAHTDAMLTVDGKIACKEVRVFTNNWADYVFDKNYKLLSLEELEKYYKTNNHLPNMPTTKDIIDNGNNLAKTDALLLEKIEELTLYIVELKKEINALKQK